MSSDHRCFRSLFNNFGSNEVNIRILKALLKIFLTFRVLCAQIYSLQKLFNVDHLSGTAPTLWYFPIFHFLELSALISNKISFFSTFWVLCCRISTTKKISHINLHLTRLETNANLVGIYLKFSNEIGVFHLFEGEVPDIYHLHNRNLNSVEGLFPFL